MRHGCVSLLVAIASLQVFFAAATAQVSVDRLAGIAYPQSSSSSSSQAQSSAYAQSAMQQAGFYAQPMPLYPSYPVIDNFSYYQPPNPFSNVFSLCKYFVNQIFSFPMKIIRCIKGVLWALMGIGGNNDPFGIFPITYPYAGAGAAAAAGATAGLF